MIKNLITFLFLLFINSIVFSQSKINAELKSLITQSFGFFPKVKEAENSVKTAEERLALTSLNKTPDIGFNTSYNFIMPKISFPINGKEIQFAPVNNINANIGANYTLIDFGRLKAGVDKSKSDIQLSKDNVELVKLQLASQIATIYYNLVYFKKAISIQDSIINYFRANKQFAENKLKNGEAIKIDVLNLQANIDAEENKKIDLQNNYKKQLILLEYASGENTSNGSEFDFSFDESSLGLSASGENNPEFSIAKDRIDIARKELEVAKLNNKPKLSLNAATGVRNGYVPYVDDIRFNYLAGVSLMIPIYGFGKTKQQIKLQETVVKQQELSRETLLSSYKKDISQTLTDISSNVERIKNTESQIEATKMAQQITTARYSNGIATYLDVSAAATNVQRAEWSKLQYEYQLCLSRIELSRLLGIQYWKN